MTTLAATATPSPLHTLLLQSPPQNTLPVHYKPTPFHRKRPRTLNRYPDGTLVVLDKTTSHVDQVISTSDTINICGGSRLSVRGRRGYVKVSREDVGKLGEIVKREEVKGEMSQGRWIKKVGWGSGGSVWLVEKEGQYLGVKVVEKEGLTEGDNALRRIVDERRALELLETRGTFVVGLEEAWQSERRLYLGMRWFGYGDLGRVLSGRYLKEETAKGVVAEIVLGLEELKKAGFVHRDLKVENILVDELGHVAIGDLGMAKYIGAGEDGKLGKTKSFCGTRSSMAPEMLMGKEYGFSVDMWALGVLIYRVLTGRMPFGRGSRKANGGSGSSIHLFHEIKTAPIKYPEFLSEDAKSLLRGLFDRYVGDRLDLSEVKVHPWFKDVDWEKLKECAVMQTRTPHASDLLQNVVPLVEMDSDESQHGSKRFFSKVTLSDLGDRDEYTPPSIPREGKLGKKSPWASGKLLFTSRVSAGKASSGSSKRKVKSSRKNDQYVKIWGYDYRAPSPSSSLSSSTLSSRLESAV